MTAAAWFIGPSGLESRTGLIIFFPGVELDSRLNRIRQKGELRSRVKSRIIAALLRLLRTTWRIRFYGLDTLRTLYSEGTPFILCFWHGKYVPIIPLLEGYRATVLTSRSSRGDILVRIFSNFGYDSIQIPDHGGETSLRMMEGLSRSPAAAIAVDGPLGPYHVVKRGVIRLASDIGFLLLPVSLDARPSIVLSGRWDRMEIPMPFSRVRLRIGTPVQPPAVSLNRDETDHWASRLAETMEDMEERTARA